jgi:NADPH:quinone reductase-like Zn-dependent oxidoreductase
VLGIEAVGVVDAVGDGVDLPLGQKVATMMGGLGRTIDGSYAEYTVVDAANTIPFDTDLDWDVVGALPEMLQTAHGALTTGLHLQAGQQVLIHGGTSTVGLTAIAIAHHLGATVIATTRNPARADLLHHVGAGHVVIDDDSLPGTVRGIATEGLDAALEFVSAAALPDVLAPHSLRRHRLLRRRPQRRMDHPGLLTVHDPQRRAPHQLRRRSSRPSR